MTKEDRKIELEANLEVLYVEIARLSKVILATEYGTPEHDKAVSELNNYRGMCRDILFDLRFL